MPQATKQRSIGDALAGLHLSSTLSCLGLFLLVSFSTTLSLFFIGSAPGEESQIVGSVTSTARIAVSLLVALFSGRIKTLLDKTVLLNASAVVMVTGIALVVLGLCLPSSEILQGLSILARVCINAAYAVLYLAWVEFYARMDMRHVFLYFSLTHLLSALLSLALAQLGIDVVTVVVLLLIPMASVMLFKKGLESTKGAAYLQGEAQSSNWSIPFRPIFLLLAFGFANNFIRFFLTDEHKGTVLIGVCVAALFALVLIVLRFGKFEIKILYLVSVPLIVAGAMCALIGIPWVEVFGALCSNAAFTLFSIFTTVIFCSMSYRYGINALWLFGFAQAALAFGSMTSRIVGSEFQSLLLDPINLTIAIALVVLVLVALSMTLITDKDFTATWGITRQKNTSAESNWSTQEELVSLCSVLSQRYGLTRREEEILVLLSQGHTLANVSEKLYIAESTMKTHSRHIYKKLGVANKQELQEFVASQQRR